MSEPKYVNHVPLSYRCIAYLLNRKWRGSTFLLNRMSDAGLLNRVARFPFSKDHFIHAPLFTDNVWSAVSLQSYETAFIQALVNEMKTLSHPLQFIDCGASFGLFSMRIASACHNLNGIVAFEPNKDMFPILESNLRQLKIPTEARHAAVSNWCGTGDLRSPENDTSPDAYYLVDTVFGSVSVTTLDNLSEITEGGLAIKIDVEGQEKNVIQGALNLLDRVNGFVVAFEAHPNVIKRTGVEPLECVRLMNKVRECTAYAAEFPQIKIDLDRPFFDQIPQKRVCNIICRSIERS